LLYISLSDNGSASHKTEEVLNMILSASKESVLPSEPGKEHLYQPSSAIATKLPSIRSLALFKAILPMRRYYLDTFVVALKYFLPIFRAPYQVMHRIVDRRTRLLQSPYIMLYHILQEPLWIREPYRLPSIPPGKACIHPRGKPRGILQSFS